MKRFFALVAALMIAGLAVHAKEAENIPLEPFEKMGLFKDGPMKLLDATKLNDGYLLAALAKGSDGFVTMQMYVPADMKSVTVGETLSPTGNKGFAVHLSKDGYARAEAYKKQFELKDFQVLKDNADLVIGSGSNELFLVTDPDCPYCKRFDGAVQNIKEDVKIYVYLKSLNIRGHDRKAVEYVLSAPKEKRAETLATYFQNGKVLLKNFKPSANTVASTDASLAKTDRFMKRFSVNGTPSLTDKYGFHVNPSKLFTNNKSTPVATQDFDRLKELGLGLAYGNDIKHYVMVKVSSEGLGFLRTADYEQMKKEGAFVVLNADNKDEVQLKTLLFVLGAKDKDAALKEVMTMGFEVKESLDELVQQNKELAAKVMLLLYKEQRMGSYAAIVYGQNGNIVKTVKAGA